MQYGTDTGRLSCVDPNLQNLPRIGDVDVVTTTSTTIGSASDGDGGGGHHPPASSSVASVLTSSVRRAFVPLPGCDLVAFDYEQIELRVLAHLSNDAQLVDALGGHSGSGLHGLMHAGATAIGGEATARGATTGGAQEIDIHRKIAAVIFRKQNPTQVTKEERTQAKRVVFGVLYGMGPRALAAQLNHKRRADTGKTRRLRCVVRMGPRALAAQLNETFEHALYIQNAFKQGFPHLEKYHARVVAQCRQENGVVRTLCGRIRTLVDINDSNQSKRSLAERQAFNTVIQGSAADVVKRAMSAVYDHVLQDAEFRGRIRLHCQVHDELVFSIPREFLHRAIVRIQECMTSCILLSVPLRVAVQVGCSYGSLVSYHQKGAS
ncbi:mitochondrial DNA polymerase I protein A, putative [Bodo saltans]|uniref:DNA-directed DNA polymerase n=1 Tax=Bodo saltans TaxID=75058 RepID=A0A0S4IQU4_BODSA|nr:mitochondrial DNA polymerase I protein A, putative [Bodo saltans]|eukprot:CUE64310.1 mitochondrial DNA polymerase I protein A, putative [Bodo saltans]